MGGLACLRWYMSDSPISHNRINWTVWHQYSTYSSSSRTEKVRRFTRPRLQLVLLRHEEFFSISTNSDKSSTLLLCMWDTRPSPQWDSGLLQEITAIFASRYTLLWRSGCFWLLRFGLLFSLFPVQFSLLNVFIMCFPEQSCEVQQSLCNCIRGANFISMKIDNFELLKTSEMINSKFISTASYCKVYKAIARNIHMHKHIQTYSIYSRLFATISKSLMKKKSQNCSISTHNHPCIVNLLIMLFVSSMQLIVHVGSRRE